jgi:hypothetical protein
MSLHYFCKRVLALKLEAQALAGQIIRKMKAAKTCGYLKGQIIFQDMPEAGHQREV